MVPILIPTIASRLVTIMKNKTCGGSIANDATNTLTFSSISCGGRKDACLCGWTLYYRCRRSHSTASSIEPSPRISVVSNMIAICVEELFMSYLVSSCRVWIAGYCALMSREVFVIFVFVCSNRIACSWDSVLICSFGPCADCLSEYGSVRSCGRM